MYEYVYVCMIEICIVVLELCYIFKMDFKYKGLITSVGPTDAYSARFECSIISAVRM